MERDFSITPLLINHQAHPGKKSWVKIFIYEPAELEVLQARGTMYAVLSLSAKNDVDFTPVMQLILEELHTQYFQQTAGSILQTLEKTLDGIHKKLILMGQEDKRLAEDFNFNLLTAVSWGTVLYFGQLGASRAALLRDGKLFDIDEGEQKTTNLYLSSGVLQSQDKVILGTNQFFKRFNRTSLKKSLSLPQDKIIASLEADLDPGPSRQNESAIVLVVDIKQVPSPQGEGLRILDPANPNSESTPATSTSQLRRGRNFINPFNGLLEGMRQIVSWKVGGFIPLVPVVLVIGAIAALFFSLSGNNDWQPQFGPNQELIASATSTISQAKEVTDVNPDRALDLLSQADGYIQQGLKDHPQNPELRSLQSQHDQLKHKILVITVLKTEEIAKENIQPVQPKLVLVDGTNYAINPQKQELISISSSGQTNVVASNFRFAEGSLLANTDEGLVIVTRGQAFPITDGGEIGDSGQLPDTVQAIAITGFSQNGYLLDASGQLYRIPHQGDAIGSISTYFQRPVGGTTLVDVAVDGSIYLLRQDGAIDVFLDGEEQSLNLERASLVTQGRAIFTSPTSDKLYILQESSIIVWNKSGKYIGQYQFSGQNKWQMATVDLENNDLYVLVEGKLLRADLPN